MSSQKQMPDPPSTRWLTTWALIATATYMLGLAVLVCHRWPELVAMDLETLATAISGAISPLALAWLVVGYFQQGIELRLNTQALRLQANELQNSVNEQKALNTHQALLAKVAQQQLVVELERSRQERELSRRSLSADIVYTDHGGRISSEESYFTLIFTNLGHVAHKVHIKTDIDLPGFEPQSVQLWGNAERQGFRFTMRMDSIPESFVQTFHYSDGLGDGQTATFSVVLSGTPLHKPLVTKLPQLMLSTAS